MYITTEELKEEGAKAGKGRLEKAILLAQDYIENMTEQFFEKRILSYFFDGDFWKNLYLPVFCKRINYIKENGRQLLRSSYTLYNRYHPDDRFNPKIVFGIPLSDGLINIEVNGDFGFIEKDESTPLLIKKACKKLALMEIKQLKNPDRREEIDRGRIISETTDGHSYTLSNLINSGSFTGDPEIDQVLVRYKRQMKIAST